MKPAKVDMVSIWVKRFMIACTVFVWVCTLIFLIKFAPDLIDNVIEVIEQIEELQNA